MVHKILLEVQGIYKCKTKDEEVKYPDFSLTPYNNTNATRI